MMALSSSNLESPALASLSGVSEGESLIFTRFEASSGELPSDRLRFGDMVIGCKPVVDIWRVWSRARATEPEGGSSRGAS